jgi:hypothetical protein
MGIPNAIATEMVQVVAPADLPAGKLAVCGVMQGDL